MHDAFPARAVQRVLIGHRTPRLAPEHQACAQRLSCFLFHKAETPSKWPRIVLSAAEHSMARYTPLIVVLLVAAALAAARYFESVLPRRMRLVDVSLTEVYLQDT